MPRSRATRAALILPSMPRTPKPPGIRMPSASSSSGDALALGQRLRVDPKDVDVRAVMEAAVAQRLDDRQVGVASLHVLADQRDAHLARARRSGGPSPPTRAMSGARRLDLEVVEQQVVEPSARNISGTL